MPTRTEYKETLDCLAALLKAKPMTAKAVARVLKCSHVAAYERLRALEGKGFKLFKERVRESDTGPQSTTYGIR